jgi:hypothetical protein
MRNLVSLALLVLMTLSVAVAKDKKEYLSARLMDVRTQKMQSSDFASNDSINKKNGGIMGPMSATGGSFNNQQQMIRYSIILTTDRELMYLSCDRDAASLQPVLKIDEYVKFRAVNDDKIEIVDLKGKKFDLEVLRRVTKDAPTLKAPAPPQK